MAQCCPAPGIGCLLHALVILCARSFEFAQPCLPWPGASDWSLHILAVAMQLCLVRVGTVAWYANVRAGRWHDHTQSNADTICQAVGHSQDVETQLRELLSLVRPASTLVPPASRRLRYDGVCRMHAVSIQASVADMPCRSTGHHAALTTSMLAGTRDTRGSA